MDDDTPEVKLLNILVLVRGRYAVTGQLVEPCLGFRDAVYSLFSTPEDVSAVINAFDLGLTWGESCANMANVAVLRGAPVATINFLAALHLKE
jgi:hypothetical protein